MTKKILALVLCLIVFMTSAMVALADDPVVIWTADGPYYLAPNGQWVKAQPVTNTGSGSTGSTGSTGSGTVPSVGLVPANPHTTHIYHYVSHRWSGKNCIFTGRCVCGAESTQTVKATVIVIKEATYTEKGKAKYIATAMGQTVRKDVILPMLAHWYGDWTPVYGGLHRATCKDEGCGYQRTLKCTMKNVQAGDEVLTICPICGVVKGESWTMNRADGITITGAEKFKGDVVVMTADVNNTTVVSVFYEIAGVPETMPGAIMVEDVPTVNGLQDINVSRNDVFYFEAPVAAPTTTSDVQ